MSATFPISWLTVLVIGAMLLGFFLGRIERADRRIEQERKEKI